jgi:anti-sigma factor RsiW
VTHLGEQISALIDGELTGAELDRASAHLAACERCRAEAAEMRQLKRALRALFEVDGDDALTGRLLAMAGPGGPVPSRQTRREQYRRGRGKGPRDKRPGGRGGRGGRVAGGDMTTARSRARYVVWSAVSLFVVGIGAAAFTMGGNGGAVPAPKITPQLEMYSVEHAIVSGTVPDPEQTPAGASTTRP